MPPSRRVITILAAALTLTLAWPARPGLPHGGALVAQEAAPRLPHGTPAVVLPVQSAEPTVAGSWPGGTASELDAMRAMDAELAFAFADRRSAEDWAMPDDLRRRVERNPMIEVDPDRVAYRGLVSEPDGRDQIYEPLHGELRALAALFGTRFVVLPMVLRATSDEAEAGMVPTSAEACPDGERRERVELLVALIDIRRSAVLWHGSIEGAAACSGGGGQLAGLAAVVARELTDS